MNTTLLTLATSPGTLAGIAALCLLLIALAVRSLRRGAAEDTRVARHVEAIRLSAYTWDTPTTYTGLSERTDTVTFPRIVLAGTVAG
jgi:hypothetical protein